jgi:hypothetical protein
VDHAQASSVIGKNAIIESGITGGAFYLVPQVVIDVECPQIRCICEMIILEQLWERL